MQPTKQNSDVRNGRIKQIRDTRRAAEILAAAKAAVCQVFNLAPETMTSHAKPIRIAWPRQIAMCIAAENTGLIHADIAAQFRKSRDAVTYSVRNVRDQRAVCKIAQRQWDECVRTYERMMQAEDENQLAVATTC